jgi:O-antigen ligase
MLITGLCLLAVAIEVVVLPGAASPFRVPKSAVALAGLAVLVGWSVVRGMRTRGVAIPRGPFTLTLLALPALYALSAAWSPDIPRTLATAAETLVWVAAIVWLATLDEAHRQRSARWASVGVCLSAVVMLLQAAGIRPLGVVGAESSGRLALTGLTGNPADLAMAAMLVLPLALEAWAGARSRVARWFVPAALLIVTGMTQTLTGLIAALALGVVWLVQNRSRRTWAVAAAVAVTVVVAGLATGLGQRFEAAARQIQRGDWYQLLSARADGWTAAVEMVHSHPVTGVGAGAYTVDYYPARLAWLEARDRTGARGEFATHFEWAHCDPLELVAETGIVGLVWMVAAAVLLWRARPRGDPVVPQMAAATMPFALLHYPLSLAVGLLPIALVMARVVAAEPRGDVLPHSRSVRRMTSVAAVVMSLAVVVWQARTLAVDIWQGAVIAAFDRVQSLPSPQQPRVLAGLEAELVRRADTIGSQRAWMLRKLGLVRLTRGDAAAAAADLRRSMELWPHEEAELGLGIALDRLDRRTEALAAIGRVVRVNPALVRLIPDDDLRRAAEDLIAARQNGLGNPGT